MTKHPRRSAGARIRCRDSLWGLTVNFNGLSNSSLESVIFPCNDQGGREVMSVSRVPEVITNSSCRCSSYVAVLLEPDSKRSSRLTDVILFDLMSASCRLDYVAKTATFFLTISLKLPKFLIFVFSTMNQMIKSEFLKRSRFIF